MNNQEQEDLATVTCTGIGCIALAIIMITAGAFTALVISTLN